MREAWCVKRDACSPKSLKIERATPHARHAWCVMRIRFGLAYSPLLERSTRITRAYHDVILWILPGTLPPPPRSLHLIQGQPRADPCVVFFSYLCYFLVTITLLCNIMWLMVRIWRKSWSPSTKWHLIKGIYKDNIRIGNICDNIAEAMDVETFIFRKIRWHVPVCKKCHRRSALGGSFSKKSFDASHFDVHVQSCNTHHASRFTHHSSRITRMWSRRFIRTTVSWECIFWKP